MDFESPAKKEGSWTKFGRYTYHRGGGAANAGLDRDHLIFLNGDYEYTIFQGYSAENDGEIIGVKVKNMKMKKTTEIRGDIETKIGDLKSLRSEHMLRDVE